MPAKRDRDETTSDDSRLDFNIIFRYLWWPIHTKKLQPKLSKQRVLSMWEEERGWKKIMLSDIFVGNKNHLLLDGKNNRGRYFFYYVKARGGMA